MPRRTLPQIRSTPEDFEVEEEPLYRPCGSGPFLHVRVEKRLVNTDEVAERLARALDLPDRDVRWAGRKDRVAVARQWLSFPADALVGGDAEGLDLDRLDLGEGVKILQAVRHVDRLGMGQLASNLFRLAVRSVSPEQAGYAARRVAEIGAQGLPNRFGRQRFGADGGNAERGRKVLAGESVPGGRRTAWLMVTAFQSQVFNEVLARRGDALGEVWTGDVVRVHDTGELAWVSDAAAWRERVERFEASATGPIFGTKMRRPRGETARLESAVFEDLGVPDLAKLRLPKGLKIFGDRRALRVHVRDMEQSYDEETSTLRLVFRLPPGSYATVLLEELFPDGFEDAHDGPEN